MDPASFWPARPEDSRKGDFGRVLVAGGSEVYAGAPAFNALAALRAGADVVHVVAPRRAADLVAGYGPDLITHAGDARWPDPKVVLETAASADALVVGGGVERSPAAHAALREIVRGAPCPLVVDAEALHALAQEPEPLRGKTALLTPHPGEFRVLAGEPWPTERAARKEATRALARRFGCTVVVKGRWDFVSDGTHVHVDEAGSPYLTKGGHGDLLAGAAGAILARGRAPFDTAGAATWLVGTAGRLAAEEFGEATLASDVLARFPDALATLRAASAKGHG
ncbi:MAG TPA: NAD(P)H-hydrate dehydratase [Candidatus Thermoplasmatota archaeon]|nr:NAD(P)H-hydrate dehydratase [Candidatus Thermoplasmatota archaeon]